MITNRGDFLKVNAKLIVFGNADQTYPDGTVFEPLSFDEFCETKNLNARTAHNLRRALKRKLGCSDCVFASSDKVCTTIPSYDVKYMVLFEHPLPALLRVSVARSVLS